MGTEEPRLQVVAYFDCTVFCGFSAFTPGTTGFVCATLGLLEQRGQNARESDEETDDQKAKPHCPPQRDVAGRAGLACDVGVGNSAGDQSENDEAGGENVKIASHAANRILRRMKLGVRNLYRQKGARSPRGERARVT